MMDARKLCVVQRRFYPSVAVQFGGSPTGLSDRVSKPKNLRLGAMAVDDNILQRSRRMDVMETLVRETRHAVRSLRRSPGFSLIAILTLGIGLGAATTIFTLLDRVVLRPLPYPNADR